MATDVAQDVNGELDSIIYHLYALMIQAANLDGHDAQENSNTMRNEIKHLIQSLVRFSRSSRKLDLDVPSDVVNYVENGRNPDIYNRDFVEAAQQMNQSMKGRSAAYAQFRDALAREMKGGMPEIAEEVDTVLSNTGG